MLVEEKELSAFSQIESLIDNRLFFRILDHYLVLVNFRQLKSLQKAHSRCTLKRSLHYLASNLVTVNTNLILMEIGKLPHRLHPTPINHNNFSTILDPVHNSSSHFEPTTGELVQDHKSPHINIFSFFDLNQIVDATFDVLFIEEGDYFVEDLEVVVDCLDGFG